MIKSQTALPFYAIPVVAILLLISILSFDLNQKLFLIMNNLTPYLGGELWTYITIFGDPLIILCIGFSLFYFQPGIAKSMLLTALITSLIVFSSKWFFNTPRPELLLASSQFIQFGKTPTSAAFPSGHTAGIFAFATLLLHFIKRKRLAFLIISSAIIIGVSRIMVGVHWPSDVAGGVIVGWVCAVAALNVTQKYLQVTWLDKWLTGVLLITSFSLIFKNTGFPNTYPLQLIIALSGIAISIFYSIRIYYKE